MFDIMSPIVMPRNPAKIICSFRELIGNYILFKNFE
jgi:hypothetical protein